MKSKVSIEKDIKLYRNFISNRQYLYDSHYTLFDNYYSIVYLISNAFLKVDKYKSVSINEMKFRRILIENLIRTIDLINLKHFYDVDKCYRSIIEAFFKYLLEIERYKEYEQLKKKNQFKATDRMKELKKISTSYKIGRLTSYTKSLFLMDKPEIKTLYDYYSMLSGSVHVEIRKDHNLEIANYEKVSDEEIYNKLNTYLEILSCITGWMSECIESIYSTSIYIREDKIYLDKLLQIRY